VLYFARDPLPSSFSTIIHPLFLAHFPRLHQKYFNFFSPRQPGWQPILFVIRLKITNFLYYTSKKFPKCAILKCAKYSSGNY